MGSEDASINNMPMDNASDIAITGENSTPSSPSQPMRRDFGVLGSTYGFSFHLNITAAAELDAALQ